MNRSIAVAPRSELTLAQILRGREPTDFERRLIDVLHDDIFQRVEDQRPSEAAALAYRRLRHLRDTMQLTIAELHANPDRLLALHEWAVLIDGTLLTILTIHFNLCIESILEHGEGRPELRPLLDELDRMDSFGVFLATELGYGNNLQALETEAVYDHAAREFVLHTPRPEAQKFMPNTGAEGVAKLGVVMARLKVPSSPHPDCGVFPFIVRIRTRDAVCPGVYVHPLGDKPDYALDNAITYFDHVRIPFHQWLSGSDSQIDEHGVFSSAVDSVTRRFFQSMNRVQAGKLCLAMGALTGLKCCVDLTLRYARQRRTFAPGREDVPILNYRSYQLDVFEAVSLTYAAAFLLQRVQAAHLQRHGDPLLINRTLALGKIFVSAHGSSIMATCRERIGAQGLFSSNRIIPLWVNMHGVITAEGDNELLLLKIGRELLLGQAYQPPAPFAGAAVGDPSLPSFAMLSGLLGEHERRSVEALRAVFGAAMETQSLYEAWNESVTAALALARLHIERMALETFEAQVLAVESHAEREILERLLQLFALRTVRPYLANLLAAGLIDRSTIEAMPKEQARLAASLHADVAVLSDSFDIPLSLVGAPIGVDYIAAYDRMQRVSQVVTRSSEI